jgi:hypothetical protein
MRIIGAAVLTAAAALIAGSVALARDKHVLRVALPDGSAAYVAYEGEVAPKVTIAPANGTASLALVDPLATAPFSELDRIAAAMDRQAQSMMHAADTLWAMPQFANDKPDSAALWTATDGKKDHDSLETLNSNAVCVRTIEMTWPGPGRQPKVVSTRSAGCGTARDSGPSRAAHPANATTI